MVELGKLKNQILLLQLAQASAPHRFELRPRVTTFRSSRNQSRYGIIMGKAGQYSFREDFANSREALFSS